MSDRATAAQIEAVNGRLKKGEGWIGYRFSTVNGEKVPSKFLYFAFYVNGTQKFVNTKTNDAEDAYRQQRVALSSAALWCCLPNLGVCPTNIFAIPTSTVNLSKPRTRRSSTSINSLAG